jgi:hypothetical protein
MEQETQPKQVQVLQKVEVEYFNGAGTLLVGLEMMG